MRRRDRFWVAWVLVSKLDILYIYIDCSRSAGIYIYIKFFFKIFFPLLWSSHQLLGRQSHLFLGHPEAF